jgi:hypothetical protein
MWFFRESLQFKSFFCLGARDIDFRCYWYRLKLIPMPWQTGWMVLLVQVIATICGWCLSRVAYFSRSNLWFTTLLIVCLKIVLYDRFLLSYFTQFWIWRKYHSPHMIGLQWWNAIEGVFAKWIS